MRHLLRLEVEFGRSDIKGMYDNFLIPRKKGIGGNISNTVKILNKIQEI